MDYERDEIALEDWAEAKGKARRLGDIEHASKSCSLTAANPKRDIVREHVAHVAEKIKGILENAKGCTRGGRKAAYEALSGMDVEAIAAIGLVTVFRFAGLYTREGARQYRAVLPSVISNLAKTLSAELWADCIKKEDVRLYEKLLKKVPRGVNTKYRLRRFAQLAKSKGMAQEPLDHDVLMGLAEPILDAVLSTGLFEVHKEYDGPYYLTLSKETAEAIDLNTVDILDCARPRYFPMVSPPIPFSAPNDGGYLKEGMRVFSTIMSSHRDRGAYKLLERSMKSGECKPLTQAVNVLQASRWTINKPVLEAVEAAHAHGWKARKLPEVEAPEVPEVPEDILEMPEEDQKAFWRAAYEAKKLGMEATSNRMSMGEILDTAHLLKDYPAIYFPHFIDRRGRVYPKPIFNFHRADYVRGLLAFADPVPLGDKGLDWLAIHVANTAAGAQYGKLDKRSYEDRKAWTYSNRDALGAIARGWREAPEKWVNGVENPFQFLAACLEWDAVCSQGALQGGREALSRLPVSIDGSCSGLQNYSAAMRSATEGGLVNLLPSGVPNDVYAAVSERTVGMVQADLLSEDEVVRALAAIWLGYGITRSVVKRQVMTFVYGSKSFGFSRQILSDLMRPISRAVALGQLDSHTFGDDDGRAAAGYLAKVVYRAIQGVVPGAYQAMEWIQAEARALVREGHHMYWRSPCGMPVVHRYYERESVRLSLFLTEGYLAFNKKEEEGRARLYFSRQSKRLNKYTQVSAAPPNVVHSLDAAHLHLTTVACAEEGITDLAMIHDSFGSHAGHVERLGQITREQFVEMYQNYNVFEQIRRQSLKVIREPSELRPLPTLGDLELPQVLSSPYFFS